ncbi:collagen alpha-1(VII) chain-like [Loxodonta africana]|uniref:collagen alpha-1(VII) chain-like n=1 Tax=Loxodonta africana TaxID=9785 RepID=UPI0030CBA92F
MPAVSSERRLAPCRRHTFNFTRRLPPPLRRGGRGRGRGEGAQSGRQEGFRAQPQARGCAWARRASSSAGAGFTFCRAPFLSGVPRLPEGRRQPGLRRSPEPRAKMGCGGVDVPGDPCSPHLGPRPLSPDLIRLGEVQAVLRRNRNPSGSPQAELRGRDGSRARLRSPRQRKGPTYPRSPRSRHGPRLLAVSGRPPEAAPALPRTGKRFKANVRAAGAPSSPGRENPRPRNARSQCQAAVVRGAPRRLCPAGSVR